MRFNPVIQHLSPYWRLARFHKPIGIFLVLWPSIWALWIAAGGFPPLNILLVFLAGGSVMRGAGCIINDIADRHFDAHVKRTADRPLATGELSVKQALSAFVILSLLGFALVCLLNYRTILWAVAGISLIAFYPFTKRFFSSPQVVLGLVFAWGVPMAFVALNKSVPTIGWWLYAATFIWIIAYDTLYAMVDRDDDIKIGIHSTAIVFGQYDLLITQVLYVVFFVCLIGIGLSLQLAKIYYAGLSVAAVYTTWMLWTVRHRECDKCFQAFLNNNTLGAIIWLAFAAAIKA